MASSLQDFRASFRFDRLEWAGAFGDLGTLIPFAVAYVSLMGIAPTGLFVSFGLAFIAAALFFRTPFPVQPMKAIGATAVAQAAQTATITAGAVHAAAAITGVIWLVLALTGTVQKVTRWIPTTLTVGLILGLGFAFMIEGLKFMSQGWLVAAPALALAMFFLDSRRFPAMFVLLLLAIGAGAWADPSKLQAVRDAGFHFQLPEFTLSQVLPEEWLYGLVFLALPQLPLTLGNAIIAVTEENNRLFPDRKTSEKTVALSTGAINAAGAAIGAVPMCHGAGGLAAHVRFGARTAGSTLILGGILLFAGLFAAQAGSLLFAAMAPAVLGAMLFLTGAQLALGSCQFGKQKTDRFVTLVVAAATIWNVGIAIVLGAILHWGFRRGIFKL